MQIDMGGILLYNSYMAEISFEIFKGGHEFIYCTICFSLVPPQKQASHVRWHDKLKLESQDE